MSWLRGLGNSCFQPLEKERVSPCCGFQWVEISAAFHFLLGGLVSAVYK
jgi:hypothetical protein